MLADISSDYYSRLEQGRDTHPSAQVLDALARATARRQGQRVSAPVGQPVVPRAGSCGYRCRRRRRRADRSVSNASDRGLSLPGCAGGQLAGPRIVTGFHPRAKLPALAVIGSRRSRAVRGLVEATDVAVSGLREAAGSDPDDQRLRSLIDELSAASERFRELWARADVGYRVGVIHIRHPKVGDLYLHRNSFNIPHSGGQHMLTYSAEPGSRRAPTGVRRRNLQAAQHR